VRKTMSGITENLTAVENDFLGMTGRENLTIRRATEPLFSTNKTAIASKPIDNRGLFSD
jgi:hypothetical protein